MAAYNCPYRKALGTEAMQQNAIWLRNYLQAQGWTLEAICAALGNWESECTLNPNRPQYAGFPNSTGGGFGVAQWTPWGKKYGAWCKAQGIGITANDNNPAGKFEPQIAYHDYECKNGVNGGKTWYSSHGYSYTWEQFKHSHDSVETLATAYYWEYERSGAMDPGSRPSQARKWYNYLSGQSYDPISGSSYAARPGMQSKSRIGNLRLLWIWILIVIMSGKGKK